MHALAHTVIDHYSTCSQIVKQNGIGSVIIKVCIFNGLQRVVCQNCSGSNHTGCDWRAMVGKNGLSCAHGAVDLSGQSIF